MKKNILLRLGAVIGGIVITLLTGLYNSTPSGLLGADWYGFPFTWVRRMVVAPQYNPWSYDVYGFIKDFVVWAVVSGVVIAIIKSSFKSGRSKGTGSAAKT